MYTGQRIDRDSATPASRARRGRRRRRSPLPLLAAALILGACLGWMLRGVFPIQAADAPSQTPSSIQGEPPGLPAPTPAISMKEPPDCPEWIEQDFLTEIGRASCRERVSA